MLRDIAFGLELAMQSALSVVGIRSGYEQPPFVIADSVGAVDIRTYGPRLVAEVSVPEGPRARDEAFRLLAGYIFGGNRSAARVAMTVPVETRSERIAMTVPVETGPTGNGMVLMRFFLPASLTAATAPEPQDARVHITEAPGETLAVRRFSGSANPARVAAEAEALRQSLAASSWHPAAGALPVFMGYDPPFTIPPLRRNEVAIRVERN